MKDWWVCPYALTLKGRCLLANNTWSTGVSDGSAVMRMTRHTFDVEYAPINGTILSVFNARPPATKQKIDPGDLYAALGQTFGVVDPWNLSSPSTIAANSSTSAFINYFVQGLQDSTNNNGDEASRRSRMVSLITLPLLLFNANGLNLYLISDPTMPSPNLPDELYTTADWATIVPRVVLSLWTIVVYLLIGVAILAFCTVSLGWSMTIQRPQITRFPLIDFLARALSKGFTERSLATVLVELTAGESGTLRRRLLKTKVFLGDTKPVRYEEVGKEGVGKIGFSITDDVEPLKRGDLYE